MWGIVSCFLRRFVVEEVLQQVALRGGFVGRKLKPKVAVLKRITHLIKSEKSSHVVQIIFSGEERVENM